MINKCQQKVNIFIIFGTFRPNIYENISDRKSLGLKDLTISIPMINIESARNSFNEATSLLYA